MKHFQKIDEGIDVSSLMKELNANPDLWDANNLRRTAKNTPHSQMSDIWVRYNDVKPYLDAGNLTGFNDPHLPVWYPAFELLPSLKPIIFKLMAMVEGEMLGGVLITRIPPNHGIAPHTDSSWHVDYFDKYYISLQSEEGANFCCEHEGITECLNPKVGDCWLFDNHKKHWVENNSNQDRITLIVCIRTQREKAR